MKKLVKFIKENKLKFNGEESALNSDCTIISGFADHCGITNSGDIKSAVISALGEDGLSIEAAKEINRVFDFAYTYNYGNWWKNRDAKRLYKF